MSVIKRVSSKAIILFSFIVLCYGCGLSGSGNGDNSNMEPTISSIQPSVGAVGDTVKILGSGFEDDVSSVSVTLNGISAPVLSAAKTEISFEVPESASSGQVVLDVNDTEVTGPTFEVKTFGSLNVFISTNGPDQDTDGYSVLLDGEEIDSVGVNDTLMIADVPTGSHTVDLSGIESNCETEGSTQKMPEIVRDGTTDVMFEVACNQVVLQGQIIFTKTVGNTTELGIMNSDGSNVRQLTSDSGDSGAEISSDGQSIVFYNSGRDDNIEIFTVDASGNPLMQVTTTANSVSNSFPTWFPDKQQIAFTQSGDASGFEDIVIANADGSGMPQNLTDGSGSNDSNADISPDGQEIVFDSDRDQSLKGIFKMNIDGTNVVKLTSGSDFESQPSWSPDGTKIAFIRLVSTQSGSAGQIFVMDSDGNNLQQVTNTTDDDLSPSWSPDGTEIVFSRMLDERRDILKINVDGTGLVNLTNTPFISESQPTWSSVE